MPVRTRVSGPLAVEGDQTGDGRMIDRGALAWDGVLPIPIVWDRDDGDHSGAVLGAIETISRRDDGVIWGDGYVEHSDVEEFEDLVQRVLEILEQGAIGVSLRLDDETIEVRVKRDLIEVAATEDASIDPPEMETDEDGNRVIVARFSSDDVLYVTTSARVRHLAIVDTAAMVVADGDRFGVAATGAIAAAGLVGEWSGREHFFDDPTFGDYVSDPRLRYDPDRQVWSCPPTLLTSGPEEGRVFGHVAPLGICLRGQPERCVTPPDGDLDGFMRGRAPAAGGRRTGVICVGGGHCDVGIGAAEATQFYDNTGRAIADVRVGQDRYGIWFSGMARPGATENDLYAFAASDVSGHWEYTQRGRVTLVGLPAVNVGGFPKGYLTYDEFRGAMAASAGITAEEGCGSWHGSDEELSLGDVVRHLEQISVAVGELYAAHLRTNE